MSKPAGTFALFTVPGGHRYFKRASDGAIYDPNKRAPIGPGLYATPVPAPDVADRGWEIAVVDDGRGNWWVIVNDGLTVHTGATWKRESDALVDVDRMILWLLDMGEFARARTGAAGRN